MESEEGIIPVLIIVAAIGIGGFLALKAGKSFRDSRVRVVSAPGTNEQFSSELNPLDNNAGTTQLAGLLSGGAGALHFLGSAVLSEDGAGDPGSDIG